MKLFERADEGEGGERSDSIAETSLPYYLPVVLSTKWVEMIYGQVTGVSATTSSAHLSP